VEHEIVGLRHWVVRGAALVMLLQFLLNSMLLWLYVLPAIAGAGAGSCGGSCGRRQL